MPATREWHILRITRMMDTLGIHEPYQCPKSSRLEEENANPKQKLLLSEYRNVKQVLQTLAIAAKIAGKTGYMLFMAVKNLLFISIEVLHSLIPSRESEVRIIKKLK